MSSRAVLLDGLAFDGSVKPDLVAPGVSVETVGADATSASTARALPPRSPPAPRRCWRRRGPRSAPMRSRDCSSAPPGRSSTIRSPRRAPARSTSAPPRPARSPPRRDARARDARARRPQGPRCIHAHERLLARADGRARDPNAARGRRHGRLHAAAVARRHPPGRSALVHIDALTASRAVGNATATERSSRTVAGGGTVRVPWAIAFVARPVDLIGTASLSSTTFSASDTAPRCSRSTSAG